MDKIKEYLNDFKKNKIQILIGLVVIAIFILIDQFTKFLIIKNVKGKGDITVIEGFFDIVYHENDGAAWSLFSGSFGFLMVMTVIALLIFVFLFRKANFKNAKVYTFSLSLMIGGLFGNLIDRLTTTGNIVVDFLDFVILGYDFPTFNVADMCLVVGVILFVVDILFLEGARSEKNSKRK